MELEKTAQLQRRFRALCDRFPRPQNAHLWLGLLEGWYSRPERAYHTLEHINELYVEFDAVRQMLSRPRVVEAAIWFHDAVYDPQANDNEMVSAALAAAWSLDVGMDKEEKALLTSYIQATAGHTAELDDDGDYFLDMDLSILGKPWPRFDEYDRAIRKEYSFVPLGTYQAGRAKVLMDFAHRRIYRTGRFRSLYEDQAKLNLKRAISDLWPDKR